MSYRCATYGMDKIGIPSGPARLICDGCGMTRTVQKPSGQPFAWLLNRKKAPGWSADFSGDMRKDWCNECTAQRAGTEGKSGE